VWYMYYVYNESEVIHCVVAGDFNCQLGSRFYDFFLQLVNDLNLQITDVCRMALNDL